VVFAARVRLSRSSIRGDAGPASGPGRLRLVYIGPAAGKTELGQKRDMRDSSSRPRAHPAFRLMERPAMRSSNMPDSEGSGGHPDQHTSDPVRRLRVPGAGAAPGQDRAAIPIGPARSRHWARSGRPGVRREYDHQPDAPAASCVAPCAFAAVRDITGRMLLVRRCDTGDWELPGGHVDPGESASDAAVRETAEESGVTVEVTGLVGIYTDPGHVIADPRAGLVRQPFAVCASMHARCTAAPPVTRSRPATPDGSPSATCPPCRSARPCACGSTTRWPPAVRATSADTGHPRARPHRRYAAPLRAGSWLAGCRSRSST
jgi:ADP-ribose pyrophosphatase YjhB (NUDIX family)